jgi:hypothetical protein
MNPARSATTFLLDVNTTDVVKALSDISGLGVVALMILAGAYVVVQLRKNGSAGVAKNGSIDPEEDKSGDMATSFWLGRFRKIDGDHAALERGQNVVLIAQVVGLLIALLTLFRLDGTMERVGEKLGGRLDHLEDAAFAAAASAAGANYGERRRRRR